MSILHPHAPERQRSITVRELDRHGIDRLDGVALLVFPGRVHCCGVCAADSDRLVVLLDGRPENERADVLYGDGSPLTAVCCTFRERHRHT